MKISTDTRERKSFFGKIMFLGAACLMLASHAQAQSADALIDKLVDKGILTVKEAQDLRDEADKDFTTAMQSKLGMADWVTGYKFSGDFRGRFDHFSSDNKSFSLYERYRYRLRFGLTVNMLDSLELGFRLGSGDPKGSANNGNPLSQNSTFQGNFSDKNIYIDAAYGRWTPVHASGWLTSITVGKMDNPFSYTPMVFDPDLTPEGAVVQTSWQMNDKQSLSLTGGAFVLNTGAFNSQFTSPKTTFFYGGQVIWKAQWTEKLATALGGGGFQIVNGDQLTTAAVPLINQGNTRTLINQQQGVNTVQLLTLQNRYAPVILDASATYTLDSFPLYKDKFPIKIASEFIQNLETSQKNQGFWVGVTFGKAGTKGTWDLTYRYERLEADAWYDQLVDDDNGAYYPGDVPTANTVPGYFGGTNVKGHMIKFNYSFTDSFTFTVTCFINDLISHDGIVADPFVPNAKTSSMIHLLADVSWAF